MRSIGLEVVLVVCLAGCGDDAQPGCDSESEDRCIAGSTSVADETNDDGAATTGGGLDTPGSSGSESSDPAEGDGGSFPPGDDSTGDESDSDGETTSNGEGNVVYSALSLPSDGIATMYVFKWDLDADRCTWMQLIETELDEYAVTVADGWSVWRIIATDFGMACVSDNPAMYGGTEAAAATGMVEFGPRGSHHTVPCDVTVDIDADFGGVFPNDLFEAASVPVAGC